MLKEREGRALDLSDGLLISPLSASSLSASSKCPSSRSSVTTGIQTVVDPDYPDDSDDDDGDRYRGRLDDGVRSIALQSAKSGLSLSGSSVKPANRKR